MSEPGVRESGVSEPGAGSIEADATAQARAIARALQLEPLPLEGGLFRRTFTGGGATAILFMLIGDDFSALHRLTGDEVYFHHGGAPLRMLLVEPDGTHHEVLVGSDVAAGEQPQLHVPALWWQGSSAAGSWSLVSTVVSPGFDWHGFTLGDRTKLTALAPAAAGRIVELTRTDPSG
ncbi:cupin domain-containing protein [Nakamurella sp.]|uniref:cupin domain-containing protein n=1 Tax=Nakamurella sp. TaxID=1869182 RepID=UPI003784AC07